MKLSVHSVSYAGGWGGPYLPLEEIIPRVAKLGYDGIEFAGKRPHLSSLGMKEGKIKKIKELLKSNNLEISCLAGYNDFSYPDTDVRFKEKELIYLEQLIRLANKFGVKIVRIFSGYLHPNASYNQQWCWCREYIKEAAKIAEDYEVVLGLQNHPAIAGTYEDILAMINEVDSKSVGIILDQAYINWTKNSIVDAIRYTGKRIVHSHVLDYKTKSPIVEHLQAGIGRTSRIETVPIGEGEVDFELFIRLLNEVGYRGFLSYEICGPIYKDHNLITNLEGVEEYLKKGLAHMRKVIEKVQSE